MSKIGIQTHGVNHSIMRKGLRGGGIAKRGTGQALKSGGRAGHFGGGRTRLLEELGRVEAEPSNRNRRAEISRVHGELNRGYKKGGKADREIKTSKGQAGLWTTKARKEFKKGGSDKNWIQKAVNPKHKGFCTPMTKKTCTPRRKALARTFKKMARERKSKG
jgi:hypothetical protein